MLKRILRSVFAGDAAARANEQGIARWRRGDLAGAARSFRHALRLRPAYAAAGSNLGMVLVERRSLDEGLAWLLRALELDPHHALARINLANTLYFDGQVDAALPHYREALRLAPQDAETRVNVVKPLMDACCWDEVNAIVGGLRELHRGAPVQSWTGHVTPYVSLLLPLPADFQKRLAQQAAAELSARWAPFRARIARARSRKRSGRIRLGYVSGDFRNNALGHLTAGMFELHDRDRFEVTAYSHGHDDSSQYRRRIAAGCERFVEIGDEDYARSASRIARDGVDILVTLSGYAGGGRSEIFAMRPAPVQVSWLGYPGTMGADFIDYFVADKVALPEELAWQFTEAPAWLPHSYQVNDSAQRIATGEPSREQAGLPREGFVFCCFNQAYKIERDVFRRWMEMLVAVPGSVLWLLRPGALAAGRLRQEAGACGVDPARIVFGEPLPKDTHLARHRLADLFLDTGTVNAHTGASDALWAGVPVLTCAGRTFAARVAASLLCAIGLEDMVAADAGAYARLGVALARDPAGLAGVRARLARNRLAAPLFDTRGFVACLEGAFETMHERARRAQPPAAFSVPRPA